MLYRLFRPTYHIKLRCLISSIFIRKIGMDIAPRPLNVLVYTGECKENVFKNIERNLLRCLHPDNYVVYGLKSSEVAGELWKENVALLIISSSAIEGKLSEPFDEFIKRGGKLLLFCPNYDIGAIGIKYEKTLCEDVIEINYKSDVLANCFREKISYIFKHSEAIKRETLCKDNSGNAVVQKFTVGNGICILSEVHLELSPDIWFHADERRMLLNNTNERRIDILKNILTQDLGLQGHSFPIPDLTAGYVVVENDTAIPDNLLKIKEIPIKNSEIKESDSVKDACLLPSTIMLPLLYNTEQQLDFDKKLYFQNLGSKTFGCLLIYFPVVTSTMEPAEFFSEYNGILVVAGRQTGGRGRSSNKWLSPEGCAMFTLHIILPLASDLGHRLPILQHLSSLAIVHGIRKRPGYNKLDLRLKWPNDIYYGKQTKIGGVIATSTIQGSTAHIFLGCGVNVANSSPTTCVNDIIDHYNLTYNTLLSHLSIEEVIAYAVTEIENLVEDFMEQGSKNFLSLYYKYWIHEQQKVNLSPSNEEATILGLNEYGFLLVKNEKQQNIVLQPDGNRFDIMKNLLIIKQ